ncbi:hypothetical protein [Enemella dayhoffiae]|uniref:hypothetical protein n=1 Tax=Enemella dayhoffiae TaxID=2016507 RepID=UPI001595BE46|nr:hypothetical protein [Enemella dayhoffiae]
MLAAVEREVVGLSASRRSTGLDAVAAATDTFSRQAVTDTRATALLNQGAAIRRG